MQETAYQIAKRLYRKHGRDIDRVQQAFLVEVRAKKSPLLVTQIILAHGRDLARKLRRDECGGNVIIDEPGRTAKEIRTPTGKKQNQAAREVRVLYLYGYDFPLMSSSGLKLGDATPADVRRDIRHREKQAATEQKVAAWQRRILKKVPAGKRVRDCWSEESMERAAHRAGLGRR